MATEEQNREDARLREQAVTQAPKRPELVTRSAWVEEQRRLEVIRLEEADRQARAEMERARFRSDRAVDDFACLVGEGQNPWRARAYTKPVKGIQVCTAPISGVEVSSPFLLFDGNATDDGAYDEDTAKLIVDKLGAHGWGALAAIHYEAWVVAVPCPEGLS